MAFHAMGVHKVLGKVPLVGKLVDAPYQRMVKKVRGRPLNDYACYSVIEEDVKIIINGFVLSETAPVIERFEAASEFETDDRSGSPGSPSLITATLQAVNIADLRKVAKLRSHKMVFDYLDAG